MLTSVFLLILRDWRIQLGLLSTQYLGVFFLIGLSWPPAITATVLIAGWTSGSVLGMAILSLSRERPINDDLKTPKPIAALLSVFTPQNIFYFISALFIVIIAFSIAPNLSPWMQGVETEIIWGGIILIGMGILQIGLNTSTFPIFLGIFTLFAGFEIIYAAIEQSILVAGLLSGVTLALALIGAYLILSPTMDPE
jgi:hypothetical protein